MSNEAMVELNAAQCVQLLMDWHRTKTDLLMHMTNMPEGTQVEVEGVCESFSGDLRRGFNMGIAAALAEISELPFTPEYGSDEPGNVHRN